MVRRVALAAAIALAGDGAAAQVREPVSVDAKIVLAVDASRSMDLREFGLQRDGYRAALRHPDFARAIAAGRHGRVAFAYFEWSGSVQDGGLVPWRIVDGPAAADAFVAEIASLPVVRSRGTSISRALAFATVLLDDDLIEAPRRIIDVSGDGANNAGPPVVAARDAAVARGITINGLPVMAFGGAALPWLDRYYEACVAGGPGAFVMVARDAETLAATIRQKLVIEVSGLAPERTMAAQAGAPVDCLIGEKTFRLREWNR